MTPRRSVSRALDRLKARGFGVFYDPNHSRFWLLNGDVWRPADEAEARAYLRRANFAGWLHGVLPLRDPVETLLNALMASPPAPPVPAFRLAELCCNCRFFFITLPEQFIGECRRAPPPATWYLHHAKADYEARRVVFTEVEDGVTCGHFSPRPIAVEVKK